MLANELYIAFSLQQMHQGLHCGFVAEWLGAVLAGCRFGEINC